MSIIRVDKLIEGDQVTLETKEVVKIRSIAPGMIGKGSKLITYTNGAWSNMHGDFEVMVHNR